MTHETKPNEHDRARRRDIGRMTAEELMIFYALFRIDHMGEDDRLKDAVRLLQRAIDRVGDYVDDINPGHKR